MTIKCTACGSEKSDESFPVYKNGPHNTGRRGKCKECFASVSRLARAAARGTLPPEDPNETRQCKRCMETRSILAFETYRSGPHSVGYRRICRACKAASITDDKRERNRLRSQEWGRKNLDVTRKRARDWREQNPERARESHALWRAGNKERVKQSGISWRQRNQERKRSLDAAWYAANKERAASKLKAYRKANRDLEALWQHNRRARKKAGGGTLTKADVEGIKRSQKGRCAYCRVRLGPGFHRDHIISLAMGGRHERKNIQLLCGPCNVRKSTKHPIAFAQERGLLL